MVNIQPDMASKSTTYCKYIQLTLYEWMVFSSVLSLYTHVVLLHALVSQLLCVCICKYGTVIGNIVSVYKSWCPLQCSVESTYLSKILRKLVTYICAMVWDVADKYNLTQWSIYVLHFKFPFCYPS